MNNKTFLLVVSIFLSGIFSSAAMATTFTIDPAYTTIQFRIKHLMGYSVGSFKKYEGSLTLADDKKSLTAVNGAIETVSLDTGFAMRDDDLRSERFFDVAKFPQLKFVSKKIESNKIVGDLTIRDVTKEVKFDYEFLGTAKDQFGNLKTAITIKGKIKRQDFGLNFNEKTDDGGMLLGDDVDLSIELHGIQEGAQRSF